MVLEMKSVEQDGVTVLVLNEPAREIIRRALENVESKSPAEAVVIGATVKLLARIARGML
jgi:hypothetical protein